MVLVLVVRGRGGEVGKVGRRELVIASVRKRLGERERVNIFVGERKRERNKEKERAHRAYS